MLKRIKAQTVQIERKRIKRIKRRIKEKQKEKLRNSTII
jgi:hypothetical protein